MASPYFFLCCWIGCIHGSASSSTTRSISANTLLIFVDWANKRLVS
ncbi:hypothetical protein N665_0402s0008 [Sinapis alba]|nr:hypothetical protein N665_0402s0008 [Sinapis alba]